MTDDVVKGLHHRSFVSCSSIHFFAGCPLVFLYAILRQFYAIFVWKGIESHGLMCSKDIEKSSVYQAVSAFVEIYYKLGSSITLRGLRQISTMFHIIEY